MSFYIGKLTRHVSKNHNEYFDGVIGGIPVRGAWSKKAHKPDNLCVFVDEEKIKSFNRLNVPYDLVGVGSAFFKLRRDFTADIVMVDGRPCAKVGRRYHPNPRLKLVK